MEHANLVNAVIISIPGLTVTSRLLRFSFQYSVLWPFLVPCSNLSTFTLYILKCPYPICHHVIPVFLLTKILLVQIRPYLTRNAYYSNFMCACTQFRPSLVTRLSVCFFVRFWLLQSKLQCLEGEFKGPS
jgi:hypothetical protein